MDINTTRETITQYVYNDNHKCTSERVTVTTKYPSETKTEYAMKKYFYNAQGNVVRIESGEAKIENGEWKFDEIKGKSIEETVYDEKGHTVKSFTYNSLDSSSKFYTESEYAEDGKVTAEIDETGENKTKLEYIDGTSVVRSKTLPNGSKFSYGHDENDTVTAITQSTEEGEENSTQTTYTAGEVTELRSGNNVVNYSYDYKRRKTAVDLNGTKEYVKFTYADKATEDGKTVNKSTATYVKRNSDTQDIFETVTDMRGNVLKTKYNGETQVSYTYDTNNKMTALNDKTSGAYSWEYDALDRVKKYSGGGVAESYIYNTDGNVSSKTVTVGGEEKIYEYTYKDDAPDEIESLTADGIKFMPQTDCLGRNTGKDIEVNGVKVASECIAYRKVGDHATNMPSVMRFGEKRNGQYVILDNIKYKYDNCGNISEVWENGKLAAKYTYDKLNRLVREDNKQLGKTWLHTYDNNGNILSKRELAFTLCNADKLEELESTDITYAYDGDRLLSFGNELFEYDGLGNPTTYRGKACVWEKGRQLASYNGNTFSYDWQGRRTSKNATQYTYDGNGNLIKQSNETNTLEFIYDNGGIAGVKHNGIKYIYRKDAQGNISAILDSNGAVVVRYIYDAWGNHAVVDANGKDLEYKENDEKNNKYYELATVNPFRYRGYYYDAETELYFLKTRYYDPEIGRFITIDDLQYLDPEHINGLNLYAYCGNNPVMNVDENGTSWWSRFWNSLVGKIVGTILTVVAVVGLVALTAVTLGAAAPVLAAGIIGGVVAGGVNIITQGIDKGYGNINFGDVAIQAISGFLYGVISVALPGVGGMFAKAGLSAITTVATGVYHGDSALTIIASSAMSFVVSLGIQQIGRSGILDKLNISHWFGKGRWVDFVSDKVMDKTLVAMDFGNYFVREMTVGAIAGISRLFNWIRKKVF